MTYGSVLKNTTMVSQLMPKDAVPTRLFIMKHV